MDRRNFMKCLGGTGLAMMCGDALAAPLVSGTTGAAGDKEQQLFKDYLHFNSNGKLKIVQFTDIHYQSDEVENSRPSIENMNEILEKEHPDFVIYTGDLVFADGTYGELDAVLEPAIRRNIPFAVVWGNHDADYDHNREELYDYVQKQKGAVMPVRTAPNSPDYVIPVKAHNSDKIVSLFYCIDSHADAVEEIGGYDWIHADQIDWYRKVSKRFTEENGGKPLPALAFFHIPVPEYLDALSDHERNRTFGVKGEPICCPRVNSGFFTALKEKGDIMGIFVGHDHDNDYAVLYKNVLLAYGRFSGGDTVYNGLPNGARIIELYEGERKLDSYIRLRSGEIESRITYPETFVAERVNKIKK